MSNHDDIPVLTDVLQRAGTAEPAAPQSEPETAPPQPPDVDALQAQICASSLQFAEEMLRDACREAEHVMVERVMGALRAELPAIVQNVLDENLNK